MVHETGLTKNCVGKSTNLAPYSFTQVVNSDPPIFVVGVVGSLENAKDTLGNIVDTKECKLEPP